jgi:hypothetical protein
MMNGWCYGNVTVSSTGYMQLPPFAFTTGADTNCSSSNFAVGALPSGAVGIPMASAGTLKNLAVAAGHTGTNSTSGKFTVYINPVNTADNTQTGTINTAATQTGTVNPVTGDSITIWGAGQSGATCSGSTATITNSGDNALPSSFVVGTTIVISGVSDTHYNGTWTITSIPSSSKFRFNIVSCSGVGTSGGGTATIPSGHGASCSSGVATITLTAALPSLFVSGSTVVVSSVSGGSGFNGTWTIASINTGTNQFTFSSASCSGTGDNGSAAVSSGSGAVCSSGVATITLTAALGTLFSTGNPVVVSGVTGGSGFTGSWTISSTNSSTKQVTFDSPSCSGSGNGGTASVTTITTGFSGATPITCTIGTAAVCTDTTHTASVSAGDLVVILGQNNSGTASASEALANIRVSLEKQ